MELVYYFIFAIILVIAIYWWLVYLDRKQFSEKNQERERIERLNYKFRESLRKAREEKRKKDESNGRRD